MKAEGGEICIHDQHYDTNNELFFMSLSTNCIPCYLKLYTEMFIKSNIQIHQMKMFDKTSVIVLGSDRTCVHVCIYMLCGSVYFAAGNKARRCSRECICLTRPTMALALQ